MPRLCQKTLVIARSKKRHHMALLFRYLQYVFVSKSYGMKSRLFPAEEKNN
jgi:hypothetical protein